MKKKINVPIPSEIDRMEQAQFPLLTIPFNGKKAVVKVRRLNYTQIRSCGDFSLISTFQDKLFKEMENKQFSLERYSEYAKLQYSIIDLALLSPTLDQVLEMAFKNVGSNNEEVKKQFKEIEDKIDELELKNRSDKMIGVLRNQLARLEIHYKYILPPDFIGFLFSYAVSLDESDIEAVSEEGLYEAAILATKGHDNPSDHYSGLFTEFNKVDIDKRAWIIYHDRTKQGA